MARNDLLEIIRDPEDKRGKIIGFRIAAWPPKKKLLNAKPIGLAYHIQRWFSNHYLKGYITAQMKEVEVKDGMMQLDHRVIVKSLTSDSKNTVRDCAMPYTANPWAPSDSKNIMLRKGQQFSADTELWHGDMDLGKMSLRWVAGTKDPLFSRLSRYERQVLYLYFSQEQSWKDIARTCRKGIKTVQDDYLKIHERFVSAA